MTEKRWVEREAAHDSSGAAIDVAGLVMAGRAVHEGRRARPAHERIDASDLLRAAMERGIELRLDRCVPPTSAPHSVVTCARRVLQLAIDAFGPPTSRRVGVHLCGIADQVAIQVTALDRHSHRRLLASESGQHVLAELSLWFAAFSPLYSFQRVRHDRANIAAVLPFDCSAPWALPTCSSLRLGPSHPGL